MSEEDKHKLSKILYYSDIHPADTEFINNIIYDLQQENKQLKEDKKKVWKWVIYKQQHSIEPVISTDELDEILEILGDKENE